MQSGPSTPGTDRPWRSSGSGSGPAACQLQAGLGLPGGLAAGCFRSHVGPARHTPTGNRNNLLDGSVSVGSPAVPAGIPMSAGVEVGPVKPTGARWLLPQASRISTGRLLSASKEIRSTGSRCLFSVLRPLGRSGKIASYCRPETCVVLQGRGWRSRAHEWMSMWTPAMTKR